MLKKLIFFSLPLFFLSACQTHFPVVSESISCAEEMEGIELADIDFLLYANIMVDSLTLDKRIQRETAHSRMNLAISPVTNKTDKEIDMAVINQAIKNRIIRSGQFILVNAAESGRYQLSGSFEEVTRSTNTCDKKYLQFLLKLMNTQTGTIVWSDKKQFR